MDDVTLTGKEFSKLHNGLCDVYNVLANMRHTLGEQCKLTASLNKAQKNIEAALYRVRHDKEQAYANKREYFELTAKEYGFKSIWCLHEVNFFKDAHPFSKATTLNYQKVKVHIQGKTWLDLYKAADEAIKLSGDEHHIYIEAFGVARGSDGEVIVLVTGS